ncbi:hypothetical protein [Novipirellula artificiosorum]|uniref:hypothetical protein n=1 Tax=Novipirellula artificiosorum TaxID=2528016 RepID=UPI0011B456FB|nr:hypothetical protein [Novipirellula artificiosorum]
MSRTVRLTGNAREAFRPGNNEVSKKSLPVGDTGTESCDENNVNCGVKPQGEVSAVASAVALHPVAPELLAIIRKWKAEHGQPLD